MCNDLLLRLVIFVGLMQLKIESVNLNLTRSEC